MARLHIFAEEAGDFFSAANRAQAGISSFVRSQCALATVLCVEREDRAARKNPIQVRCEPDFLDQVVRQRRTSRLARVPGFTMAAWVASHAPECTELTVEGDRGLGTRRVKRKGAL